MTVKSKVGVTLAAMAALGLAGGQIAHAQTEFITYDGSILGQSDLAQVATDGYELFNFTSGDDFDSSSISDAIAPYFTTSNGHFYSNVLGTDLTQYGAYLAPASPGLYSSTPDYVSTDILDSYAEGSSVGGYAHLTDSVDGTDGYLGTIYSTLPPDPNNPLGLFQISSLDSNNNSTFHPDSLTVGFLVSGNAAPGTITFSDFNNSAATATATPVPVASGSNEADYYIFTIHNPLPVGTGLADFEFTATANTDGLQSISGITFGTPTAAITPPPASAAPEPSQLAGLGFTIFGVLGLILKARKRSQSSSSPLNEPLSN